MLERPFLVRVGRPWHVNLGKRQVKAAKLYVSDPGLLGALVGADEGRVRGDDGLAGAMFETFVATELERQASFSPEPLTFWHYREGEREIDVAVERPSGEIVGVEAKAGATSLRRTSRASSTCATGSGSGSQAAWSSTRGSGRCRLGPSCGPCRSRVSGASDPAPSGRPDGSVRELKQSLPRTGLPT